MDQFPNPYKFLDDEEWEGQRRAHLHTLSKASVRSPLVGTSSVSSIVAKPLTYWAVGLALVKLGWVNHSDPELAEALAEMKLDKRTSAREKLKKLMPHRVAIMEKRGIWKQIQTMTASEFAEAFDAAYFAHVDTLEETADDGTDLHAECESFIKAAMGYEIFDTGLDQVAYSERIAPFVRWAKDHVSKFLWSEMHAYSEKMWTGCISDGGYLGVDGKIGVIEFKRAKAAYDEHYWQVGGQHLAIEENGGFDKDGNKIFELPGKIEKHMVFAFGAKDPGAEKERTGDDIVTDCRAFKAELYLYKVKNNLPLTGF